MGTEETQIEEHQQDEGGGTSPRLLFGLLPAPSALIESIDNPLEITAASLGAVLLALLLVFASTVAAASSNEPAQSKGAGFSADPSDQLMEVPVAYAPMTVVGDECYLDRNRDFHLLCRVIPESVPEGTTVPPLEGIPVEYVLYGKDGDTPYSSLAGFTDENGWVDVIVDFAGLTPWDPAKTLGAPDDLRSYDICAVNGRPIPYDIRQHEGEAAFACSNWLTNSSWYIVDYRSWGSRSQASTHSGHSPDPAVRERFTWWTAPQYGPDANADGSCNYWDGRNWILVHDYSWMGQVWLTMCPGMIYYIDGVEYEAKGVFNIDRNNTIDAIYAITGTDPLIIQTCDGWVDVRVIYGYPTNSPQPQGGA